MISIRMKYRPSPGLLQGIVAILLGSLAPLVALGEPVDANSREITVYYGADYVATGYEAVSREITVFNGAEYSTPGTDAVSREFTVFNGAEFSDPNNVAISRELTIYLGGDFAAAGREAVSREISVRSGFSDLNVTAVSAPAAVTLGQSVLVTWTVRNDGQLPALGNWVDRVYISVDAVLDAEDVQVAEVLRAGPLDPSTSYDAQASVPALTCVSGSRLFIVRSDATGVNFDPNSANNVRAAAPTQVTVLPDDCNGNGVSDATDIASVVQFANDTSLPAGADPYSIVSGDLTGDGRPDLVVVNALGNNCSVYLNNGSAFVAAGMVSVDPSPRSACIAYLDNDVLPDLAVACYNTGKVSILRNQGNGTFAPAAAYSAGSGAHAISAGDLDGDGKVDLVVANTTSNTAAVLRNLGGAVFDAPSFHVVGNFPRGVTLLDVDGDGRLDIASSNTGPDTVSILHNNGGGFDPAVAYPVGRFPFALSSGDWNGDNHPDLAVVNSLADSMTMLFNNGSGGLVPSAPLPTGDAPRSVQPIDVDGDGLNDIVVANYQSSTLSMYRNLGGGAFAVPVPITLSAGSGCHGIAVGDFNADGRPDIALANRTAAMLGVLRNQTASPVPDCNHNGIPDSCDIQCGMIPDQNGNGVPDSCEQGGGCSTCPGDVTGDQQVDGRDVQMFVNCLLSGMATGVCSCADFGENGGVAPDDIAPFVVRLLNGAPCP